MDQLRLHLIGAHYQLKLTAEESKNAENIDGIFLHNTSWLMQDRGDFQFTHPEYPGPFAGVTVANYHIYCSLEMWQALGKDPIYHWDYREDDGYYSYNPSVIVPLAKCCMFLPKVQRKKSWTFSKLGPEIFDNLSPDHK